MTEGGSHTRVAEGQGTGAVPVQEPLQGGLGSSPSHAAIGSHAGQQQTHPLKLKQTPAHE